MTDTELAATLLAAYDAQMRAVQPVPAPGVGYEHDGALLRVVGQHRGFVTGPHDWGGLRDAALDAAIVRQRDFFAARGEGVERKVRGYDVPADLPDRLRAAGFVPEPQETVVIAPVADLAVRTPALPPEVTLRRVTDDADLDRIAALETVVWGEDMAWIAEYLRGRLAVEPDGTEIYAAEAAGNSSPLPGWPCARARGSPRCWAAPRWHSGAARASTEHWSPYEPPGRRPEA